MKALVFWVLTLDFVAAMFTNAAYWHRRRIKEFERYYVEKTGGFYFWWNTFGGYFVTQCALFGMLA